MLEERKVFLRGDLVPWNDAKIHIMSHSLGRGSAIFEVLSFHDTERGPAVFRLDEHVKRLFRSAGLLELELPLSESELIENVIQTVRVNKLREGFVKIICFFSSPSFSILPPEEKLDVSIFAIDPEEDMGLTFSSDEGVSLCIPKWRKLDPQTAPIEAKASANYLNGMMARIEAKHRGFDYALMLDTQGFLAEGGTEAIFIVRQGRLHTPAVGTILGSISRMSLLSLSKAVGIEAAETRLRPRDLSVADEIFLASTGARVLPVSRIEDHSFAEAPGPISQRLNGLVEQILAGRDDRFADWLFPV